MIRRYSVSMMIYRQGNPSNVRIWQGFSSVTLTKPLLRTLQPRISLPNLRANADYANPKNPSITLPNPSPKPVAWQYVIGTQNQKTSRWE